MKIHLSNQGNLRNFKSFVNSIDLADSSNLDITVKPGTIETRWIPEAGKPGHPNVAGYHRAYLEWEYPGSQKEYYAVSQQVSGVLK